MANGYPLYGLKELAPGNDFRRPLFPIVGAFSFYMISRSANEQEKCALCIVC